MGEEYLLDQTNGIYSGNNRAISIDELRYISSYQKGLIDALLYESTGLQKAQIFKEIQTTERWIKHWKKQLSYDF